MLLRTFIFRIKSLVQIPRLGEIYQKFFFQLTECDKTKSYEQKGTNTVKSSIVIRLKAR